MYCQFGSTVLRRYTGIYCKLQLKRRPLHTRAPIHLHLKRFSNILKNGSWCIPKSNQVESPWVWLYFCFCFWASDFLGLDPSPPSRNLTKNPRNDKTRRIWIFFLHFLYLVDGNKCADWPYKIQNRNLLAHITYLLAASPPPRQSAIPPHPISSSSSSSSLGAT